MLRLHAQEATDGLLPVSAWISLVREQYWPFWSDFTGVLARHADASRSNCILQSSFDEIHEMNSIKKSKIERFI
jgi:hypothetical protein